MLCVRLVFGVAGGRAHARHSCEKSSGKIRIYNVRENFALAGTVELHKTTVLALKVRHVLNPALLPSYLLQYNPVYNTVISCEERGLLNYWSGSAPSVDKYLFGAISFSQIRVSGRAGIRSPGLGSI